jgi:hypothetical protein
VASQPHSQPSAPLFSIIIPFEFHRGQWEQCLLAWRAQTLLESQFEIILVVPPDFPPAATGELSTIIRAQDRIEFSSETHDIGLCAVGGRLARGTFVFFTEAHCRPEPDVLEKCLKKFELESDLAGFSCRSVPITHNRLSIAESRMYGADIEYAMTVHPWRKILDQCFATRRDCYQASGGFDGAYGHFSEWVLAANYFALGFKVGYEPAAVLHHYYVGDLRELREFTRDFADGEMRYFANLPPEPGGNLLEIPSEWACGGQWDRQLAWTLLRLAFRHLLDKTTPKEWYRQAAIGVRWLMPAVFGASAARMRAAWQVGLAGMHMRYTILVRSPTLDAAFKAYISALVHHQRIVSLMASGSRLQTGMAASSRVAAWDPFAPENTGFYEGETFEGTKFRWSEAAAILPAWMAAGRHQIRIECMPFRDLEDRLNLRVFINGKPASENDVSISQNAIDVRLHVPRSGPTTLAWMCRRLRAGGDPRSLGLPVARISSNPI